MVCPLLELVVERAYFFHCSGSAWIRLVQNIVHVQWDVYSECLKLTEQAIQGGISNSAHPLLNPLNVLSKLGK